MIISMARIFKKFAVFKLYGIKTSKSVTWVYESIYDLIGGSTYSKTKGKKTKKNQ